MANARNFIGLGMPAALANEVAAQIGDGPGVVESVNGQTGEVVLDAEDVGALAEPTPATAIPDLALTGTYGDDDDSIEAAVNGVLAILRANGFLASE